jgi:1,2-diacylglycerol 3-alpha-glucosyltransferase
MKIAIMSQSYPPMVSGAAIFAEQLATHIAERGHTVLVQAASEQRTPYRSCQPNLSVERFRSYRNPLRVGQRFSLWPHRQITTGLAGFSPDLIHIHDPFQFGLSGLAFGRSYRIPVVYTIHQLPWFISAYLPVGRGGKRMMETALWRYGRWVLSRCSRVAVGSPTIAEMVSAQIGIDPQVISIGIDLDTFSPAPSSSSEGFFLRTWLGIPEGSPIILHVGRLDQEKQVDRVIQAARLAMQQTQAHLLIVGDGTERGRLTQLCSQLGIAARCHFTGYISRTEVPAFYRLANVFVTTSEIEIQGMVVLEAAASALPIIAVRASSLPEIVHDGQNGFLLQPGDLAGMADRLVELVQYPELARKMGESSRKMVECHASEKTFDAYEALYRTVLQAGKRDTVPGE